MRIKPIVWIILVLILVPYCCGNYKSIVKEIKIIHNDDSIENNQLNYSIIKPSNYWPEISPIHINGSATGINAHNWTWAANQDWCNGEGTWGNPYIIENLTTNAYGLDYGIKISNSFKYFIIRNSTILAASVHGIYLENTHNGTFFNNSLINNNIGIDLDKSYNNTIIYNNFVRNHDCGIHAEMSNDIKIKQNNINSNNGVGISFINCNFTEIESNYINTNIQNGIILENSDDAKIRNNTITNNGVYGIELGYLERESEKNLLFDTIKKGHFKAKYSFTYDDVNSTPKEWTITSSTTKVISEIDEHKKIVLLSDIGGRTDMYQDFLSQPNGTVEFWIRTNDISRSYGMYLKAGSGGVCTLDFNIEDGEWKYGIQQGWTRKVYTIPNLLAPENDRWYHVKIHFRVDGPAFKGLNQYEWKVIIDGKDSGNLPFRISNFEISAMRFISWEGGNLYLDAIDYSWSEGYFEGRNAINQTTDQGICLKNSDFSIISNNNISDNGIGLFLENCSDLKVINNNISIHRNAIYLTNCYNNTISNNKIVNTSQIGIYLENNNHNNSILENNFTFNHYGLISNFGGYNNISNNIFEINEEGIGIGYNDINNTISRNMINHCNRNAIYLLKTYNNTALKNNITNSKGICLKIENGGHNKILQNNLTNYDLTFESWGALFVQNSKNNLISGNNMNGNGFGCNGSLGELNSNYIETTNLVNNKPLYYLINKKGFFFDQFFNVGQIVLINCSNSEVRNLYFTKVNMGILLYYSENNTVSKVTINSSQTGIILKSSFHNNITDNLLNDNLCGIALFFSDNNNITNNSLISNNYSIYYNYYYIGNNFDNDNRYLEEISSGIYRYEIKPIHNIFEMLDINNDYCIKINISISDDSKILLESFDTNPTNVSLNNKLIFLEMMLNQSANLNGLTNISIQYIGAEELEDFKIYYFNRSSNDGKGGWEKISFIIEGNKISFSIDHLSYFALSGRSPQSIIFPVFDLKLSLEIKFDFNFDKESEKLPETPSISSYSFYLLFMTISIFGIIFHLKRKKSVI